MFHTYVANVLSGYLRICCNGFQVFHASVSDACFKCFICLQTYVANVSSECFKSRSAIAHVAGWRIVACGRTSAPTSRLPHEARLALSSPSPPFPSLHLVAAVQAQWETLSDKHANARGGGDPRPTAA
jgi:hypothetical protein